MKLEIGDRFVYDHPDRGEIELRVLTYSSLTGEVEFYHDDSDSHFVWGRTQFYERIANESLWRIDLS